jgi:hypothetical protein
MNWAVGYIFLTGEVIYQMEHLEDKSKEAWGIQSHGLRGCVKL